MSNGIPFVEYYRPTNFKDIILSPLNKQIFENILKTKCFPNLLFYGPPGTGKTTTIVNLIESFQEMHQQKNSSLIIHLNASDERGIDTIRNQIHSFVTSNTMFCTGMKFVILDEVDYMTKNAQQSLRNLLQIFTPNVRFCLICNYINRIEEGLQNEFIKFRFNQLPKDVIIKHLLHICKNESIHLIRPQLVHLQEYFHYDIRSMINYIQIMQNNHVHKSVIHNKVYEKITKQFCNKNNSPRSIYLNICNTSQKYNLNCHNFVKNWVTYLMKNTKHIADISAFLSVVENLLHSNCRNSKTFLMHAIMQLKKTLV